MEKSKVLRCALPGRLVTVVVLSLALSACGGDGSRSGGTAEPKTAVVAYSFDMEGVNELITGTTPIQTALLYFGLFLSLLEELDDYQEGPPTHEPRLAESWEFSEDRTELTFHLRPDVVWSDGVPVTAEDVRWTWQAQTSPDIAWTLADSKARIDDVEVVDRHTVRFHFSQAYATQLQDANIGVILPKHAWGELPFAEWRQSHEWFIDHLVVNGPFTLESRQPQQRFVLRRNESYFEPGLPKLDRLVFEVIPEAASQLALLRSGQVHFIEWVAPSDAVALENDPDVYLTSYLSRQFYFVQWNVRRPLFASKEVRQALTMGIDRAGMIESLHHGYADPSYSPFPSNIWAHNKNLEPWPYDPMRAREILTGQGWTDSDGDGILDRDGEPFRFELLINTANTLRRDIMIVIQAQLRQIGVDVRTRVMEISAMMAPLRAHDFEALIFGFALDTSLDLSFFVHSRAIDDGYNWGGFSHPEVDRLLEEIASQVDQLAAKPLYDELQAVLHEEQPYTFLYESQRVGAVRRELAGIHPTSVSSFFGMKEWRLVEDGG